jgi:flagellar export protein FliJ
MRSRSARFEKLLTLRVRELDLKKADLARANDGLRRAQEFTQERQEQLRQAARLYRGDGEPRNAAELLQSSEWLRDRVSALERSLQDEQRARQAVEKVQGTVIQAEREKRKMELLLERIHEEELAERTREEQRQTDEVAQQKTQSRARLA